MYTASAAFFEGLYESGIRACFVNLGSDHPSILEAMVKAQNENAKIPKIYTCPNEMVALSMADGYARVTGQPQCVIVHVDVGTQGLAAAVHNASCGRCPVLIFAGLSPFTIEGEMRGSRTEYIHWIQDVPDQKQIVAQYCRYTGEIKTGRNIKQMVNRALQFATSDPQGPVYIYGAREAMEEEINPYSLDSRVWQAVGPTALPQPAIEVIAEALAGAKEPLIVTGYSGRNQKTPGALVELADLVKGLRVIDCGGSDMCFPSTHPAWLGLKYGVSPAIKTADVILVLDCDVPWINTHNTPKKDAKIFHIDVDPLKQQMPVFYIDAEGRWKADSYTAITQLNTYLKGSSALTEALSSQEATATRRLDEHKKLLQSIAAEAKTPEDGTINAAYLSAEIKKAVPEDTIFVIEAVTNTGPVGDQIQPHLPGSWLNCGGGGLGWSGGAALGIKLASEAVEGAGKSKFICQIVGDGTYLFTVPSSVHWVAARYKIPVLTVVLNNKGWNAPRRSMLLVHPNGLGSKATNEDLHISFAPTPDYAGIGYAASGGEAWAGRASTPDELASALSKAVKSVKSGTSAIIDAHLGGSEGKFMGYQNHPDRGYGTGMANMNGTASLG